MGCLNNPFHQPTIRQATAFGNIRNPEGGCGLWRAKFGYNQGHRRERECNY
jgi:hypothetical protein